MTSIIPCFLVSACFFVFFAIGLALVISKRENVVERFAELYFALLHRSYEDQEDITDKSVIVISRVSGAFSLTIALASAWYAIHLILPN